MSADSTTLAFGANEGGRTLTVFLPGDFKSPVSANSTTLAYNVYILFFILTRLSPYLNDYGADDETRTRNFQLGRMALYQLSYIRIMEDSVGFEPTEVLTPLLFSRQIP